MTNTYRYRKRGTIYPVLEVQDGRFELVDFPPSSKVLV